MSIAQTNTVAKAAALVAGLGLVAMTFVAAAPAKADTVSDLQAQIAALQAQLSALSSSSSSTGSCAFNTDLTMGAKGADVTALQNWLIKAGYSIPAGATGYFGSQTKAAVAAYQAAKGISPAVGYFGPMTRASVNGSCSSTDNNTNSSLSGKGYLKNLSEAGDITTDIKEGDGNTQVLGISADAQDGDVQIQRVEATFTIANSGGSSNLNKYVSSVGLYLDGKKLASMDPADGTKDGRVWTYRFTDLNGVIKSGATGYLYVKVTPVASIGSDEDGDTVTVKLTASGIRAVGGDGISDTYLTSSDSVVSTGQGFTVSTSIAGTLTVSEAGDNPKASQVAVSSSTTSGVTLLSINAKAKNTDVKINDLAVSLGTSDSLSDVVSTVKLMKGSTVVKTKTVTSGTYQVVTFDNINQTISKDSTQNYTVVVDIKGDSAYADGTTLVASSTTTGWDAEDNDGASVTPSAAVVGNTMTLTATGVTVTRGTPTATVNTASFSGGVDTATFTIPFTVTAGDTDIYVAGAVQKSSSNNSGKVSYGTTTTSTQGATGEPTANISVADSVTGDSSGSYYKVLANTSRTFTLNVSVVASSTGVTAGYVGAIINSIAYGTVAGTEATYYTSNLDTFKTNDVYVQKH